MIDLFKTASTTLAVFVSVASMCTAPTANAAWFSTIPSEIPETPIAEWQPSTGDFFIADTQANIGYLVHTDGGFTSFPVVTGQKRIVRYIGRTYNAATPDRHWVSESREIKDDRITFGKEGTFLRLSYEGDDTPYGIHTHASADSMLGHQMRYRSMGCIIVSKPVLDIVVQTFGQNGKRLDVLTVDGFGDDMVNYATLKEKLAGA